MIRPETEGEGGGLGELIVAPQTQHLYDTGSIAVPGSWERIEFDFFWGYRNGAAGAIEALAWGRARCTYFGGGEEPFSRYHMYAYNGGRTYDNVDRAGSDGYVDGRFRLGQLIYVPRGGHEFWIDYRPAEEQLVVTSTAINRAERDRPFITELSAIGFR